MLIIEQSTVSGRHSRRAPETRARWVNADNRLIDSKIPDLLAAVHYKPIVSKEDHIYTHATVKTEDAENLQKDWRSEVNMPSTYDSYKSAFLEIITEFELMWDGHLGRIDAAVHRIAFSPEDARQIHSAPYRAGPKARELEKTELDNMLRMGVIDPAQTGWDYTIVFVQKKGGSLLLCLDYRKLNAVTVRESYPIPRIDECIDSLGEARIFSTLDANAGYWQVEIDPNDRDKTAFTSHHGLYRFIRMPLGLKNAPGTFQRAIDVILSTVRFQYALVYLDDVVVFSNTPEEHLV